MSPDSQPFQHYTIKSRIVAWLSKTLFDHITYTSRHGLTKGLRRKGGLGWIPPALMKQATTREEQFWHDLNVHDQVIYDVGAYHGLLTIFFAQSARQVVSYEPNPDNERRLVENVRLNKLGNVTLRNVGLGSKPGMATMATSSLMPGGSTIDESAVALAVKQGDTITLQDIRITTLDEDIAATQLPAPDFIKIDVEGLEIGVLRGAVNTLGAHRPALFLEMHGSSMTEKRRKVKEIVVFLNSIGYHDIRHIQTGTDITPDNSEISARGHLYCPRPAGVLSRSRS